MLALPQVIVGFRFKPQTFVLQNRITLAAEQKRMARIEK